MDIPARERCLEILEYFVVSPKTFGHCMAVADLAREIAEKLVQVGHPLDIKLVEAAALLHDVARYEKEHALIGGQRIRELGYPNVAEVIEAHMDLPQDAIDALDERAVVYLADKLFIEDKRVGLEERFERAVCRFKDDEKAIHAIGIRLDNARRVLQNIQKKTGGNYI